MDVRQQIRERLASVDDPVALLEGFFANAPVGLQVYRADGHCLLVNQAFIALFGSQPPPEYNVLEDDVAKRSGILDLIHRAFAGETTRVPPVWYDPRDLEQVKVTEGRRVAIEAVFFPLVDRAGKVTHVAIVFEDRTAQLLAQKKAEEERERLRAVLEQLPDGVLIVTPDGSTHYANRVAGRIDPRVDTAVPERTADASVLHPDGTPYEWTELPAMRAARGEQIVDEEVQLVLDGETRILSVNAGPRRDEQGNVVEGIAAFRDVTARRRAEDEVRRLSSAKDEFLSIASHELRTPLTAIRAGIQAARRKLQARADDASVETVLDVIGRAEQQTARMWRLIEELLDVTRIDAGALRLSCEPHDLGALVRRACVDARGIVGNHAIEVTVDDGDLTVVVDEGRVEQVLFNVLVNAARHSPDATAIDVHVGARAEDVFVTITDRGPGVAPEDIAHVFDRFYRGRAARDGRTGGMGLGLYIASEIARRHGGRMEVENRPGAGARFTLLLRRAAAQKPPAV